MVMDKTKKTLKRKKTHTENIETPENTNYTRPLQLFYITQNKTATKLNKVVMWRLMLPA